MRSRSRVVAAALASVLAFGAAACSGDDDSGAASSTTTSSSSTTTSTVAVTTSSASTTSAPTNVTTEPCAPPANGSVAPQTSPTPGDVMVYTAVKVTTKDCVDTVEFDFDSDATGGPGYRVEYQPGPFTEDASGKPVTIAGSAFLVVRLEPATGFDFVKNELAYKGPSRIPQPPHAAFVTEVVRTGDFESVTTWIIGLAGQVPFTVTSSGAPDHRLSIAIGA